MVVIESAGLTDVGQRRKTNEDALLRDDRLKLYLVADGMGGHKAGEVASHLVTKVVSETLVKHARQVGGSGGPARELVRMLTTGIQLANSVIFRLSEQNPDYRGMGSTLAAVLLAGNTLVAANVGDSPIYLFRGDKVEVLSTAHTFMAEYASRLYANSTSPPAKYRHVITRSIGSRKSVTPDVHAIPCVSGDIVLLCSDGLSNLVGPEEMAQVVLRNNPGMSCRLLVDLANDRGGEDNITLIVIKVLRVTPPGTPLRQPPAACPSTAAPVPGQEAPAPAAGQPDALPPPPPGQTAPSTAAAPEPAGGPETAEPLETSPGGAAEICVEYDTDEFSTSTHALQLSTQEVLIETSNPLATGQELLLTLSLPGAASAAVTVSARVASRSGQRVALRFLDLSPEQRASIEALQPKS
jgi:protein phosphatase